MPPKPKYTKEEIVEAAFGIAAEEGMDAISIRRVAAGLGSSIAPIYVNFDDVEDLKRAVVKRVVTLTGRLLEAQDTGHPFFDVALASIGFARQYPSLFRDLVLKPNPYLPLYESEADGQILEEMRHDPDLVGLGDAALKDLLLKMRVFHVGLSAMAANGLLPDPTESRLIDMLRGVAGDLVRGAHARKGNAS
jgi:AcrR family transcriptional regulator